MSSLGIPQPKTLCASKCPFAFFNTLDFKILDHFFLILFFGLFVYLFLIFLRVLSGDILKQSGLAFPLIVKNPYGDVSWKRPF